MGRARWVGAMAAALVLAAVSSSEASPTRFRLVVRIASETSRTLWDRVRGQTSDVDLELVAVETPPLESTRSSQLRFAATLARQHQADAVVWYDDVPRSARDSHVVLILQIEARRLLVRDVEESGAARSQRPSVSAELETAAVIVRVAAQALMQGNDIGVETPIPPAPDPLPPPASPDIAPPPPVSTGRSPWKALGLLGWQVALDGTSPRGHQGVAGRLGVSYGAFTGGVAGVVGIQSEIVEPLARFTVSHHTLALWAAGALFTSERITIGLGAQGGLTLFRRATTATADNAQPAPSQSSFIPFIGPEVRTGWRPAWLGGWAGFSVVAGCDVIPQAPVLGYNIAGNFVPAHRFWALEPRLAFALEFGSR